MCVRLWVCVWRVSDRENKRMGPGTLSTTASVCQQKQEKVSVDHAPKNGLIAL